MDLRPNLKERINKIENYFNSTQADHPENKIAVFDMDNTLLDGDIGDAVFAQLKEDEKNGPLTIDKRPIPLTWSGYEDILAKEGKHVAYKRAVTAMAGIPLETLLETSARVMRLDEPFIKIENKEVPVPVPSPGMPAMLAYLRELGFSCYIISATNHFTVEYVGEHYFGFPPSDVYGIKPAIIEDAVHGKVLGDQLTGPVTVGTGKVDAYRQLIGTAPPILSAGDSDSDIDMLNLTVPEGLVILKCSTEKRRNTLKQQITHPDLIYMW
ncbi:MAG: haloacid dehalogenase-like hydrolase [bacterium]|nr:haloacid dehalogenase-like hydrolase [bacterium]